MPYFIKISTFEEYVKENAEFVILDKIPKYDGFDYFEIKDKIVFDYWTVDFVIHSGDPFLRMNEFKYDIVLKMLKIKENLKCIINSYEKTEINNIVDDVFNDMIKYDVVDCTTF